MARLFDAGSVERTKRAAKENQDEVRSRVAEAERQLAEIEETDAKSIKLRDMLQASTTIQTVRYESYRPPGSKWMIEHGRDGENYVYQMFPLKPPKMSWQDTVAGLIAAMDVIFPRSVELTYIPPNPQYQITFFTVRVDNVTKIPGWESACKERALRSLVAVNAW